MACIQMNHTLFMNSKCIFKGMFFKFIIVDKYAASCKCNFINTLTKNNDKYCPETFEGLTVFDMKNNLSDDRSMQ